ncbi:MAG: PAS domain-containing protein, partial [Candidatus Saccharibacteria bacterium]
MVVNAIEIVEAVSIPLIVLDLDLRVIYANKAFYSSFNETAAHTEHEVIFDLGNGQWDIPALRVLLETIIPEKTAMDGFEVEHDFPGLGRRTMLLNARK